MPRCERPVYGLSRYCERHMYREKYTGDPLGRTLGGHEVKPFMRRCRRFIDDHRHHPGVSAALDWIGRYIQKGAARAPSSTHRNSLPRDRVNAWLRRLWQDEVEPIEVLAWTAGCFLMRDQMPAMFQSERHWRHTIAYRVCRLANTRIKINRRGKPMVVSGDVTPGTRDLLAEQLVTALGVLCARMVEAIRRQDAEEAVEPVEGSDQPFCGQQT